MLCRLLRQLQADCALLTELRVMDYSLLLGVHYRSPGYQTSPQVTDRVRWPSSWYLLTEWAKCSCLLGSPYLQQYSASS